MNRKPYGQICPISRACEFLEPRWTIPILSEMWGGSSRFNDIRRGVGNISPALLSRRLKEMEANGLVERIEDRGAGTVDYVRTPMAIALEPAMDALALWAQRNIEAELAICSPNLSTVMWKVRRLVDPTALPARRVVIRFHFPDADTDYDTYWLVAQPGTPVELCSSDPVRDVDLYVETSVATLSAILLGRTTYARATEEGSFFTSGDRLLSHGIGRWLPGSGYAKFDGIAMFPPRSSAAR